MKYLLDIQQEEYPEDICEEDYDEAVQMGFIK